MVKRINHGGFLAQTGLAICPGSSTIGNVHAKPQSQQTIRDDRCRRWRASDSGLTVAEQTRTPGPTPRLKTNGSKRSSHSAATIERMKCRTFRRTTLFLCLEHFDLLVHVQVSACILLAGLQREAMLHPDCHDD